MQQWKPSAAHSGVLRVVDENGSCDLVTDSQICVLEFSQGLGPWFNHCTSASLPKVATDQLTVNPSNKVSMEGALFQCMCSKKHVVDPSQSSWTLEAPPGLNHDKGCDREAQTAQLGNQAESAPIKRGFLHSGDHLDECECIGYCGIPLGQLSSWFMCGSARMLCMEAVWTGYV